jgi:hypothetical protein
MANNEIATRDDMHTDLSVLPPAPPSQQTRTAVARQVLRDHAELSEMAWQFANKLVGTKMVPDRFRNQPEEATAAILYGAELGMGPISALQNIFEVKGSPGIYARTAQALLEAKGFQFKTVETTNEVATVRGWKPGHQPEQHDPDEQSTFTYEDAERAGWTPQVDESPKGGRLIRGIRYQLNTNGKLVGNEKYLTQPRQMLWAKAMMETCRHLSPATLSGIAYSIEELESEHSSGSELSQAGRSAKAPEPQAPLTVEEILNAAPEQDQSARSVHDLPEGYVYPPTGVDTTDPETAEAVADEPEPAPTKAAGKRAAAKEQREAAAKQKANLKAATKKLPRESADRVAAALSKARTPDGEEGTEVPETTPAADPEPETSPGTTEQPEPAEDPGEPDPYSEGQPENRSAEDQALDDAFADELAAAERANAAAATEPPADPEPVKAPADWDGAKPATRDQLTELTKCIAAAGFQPTTEGKAQWFAWLSQEVDRDIAANNQLSRREILAVIESMQQA